MLEGDAVKGVHHRGLHAVLLERGESSTVGFPEALVLMHARGVGTPVVSFFQTMKTQHFVFQTTLSHFLVKSPHLIYFILVVVQNFSSKPSLPKTMVFGFGFKPISILYQETCWYKYKTFVPGKVQIARRISTSYLPTGSPGD